MGRLMPQVRPLFAVFFLVAAACVSSTAATSRAACVSLREAGDVLAGTEDASVYARHRPSWPPIANTRPLIGILSQPGDPAEGKDSYIAASYIKFVEAGGARVVPFLHDMPAAEVRGE
jgi:hypothetical protein